ncbi:MAG: methyl-accepting chemotaxis protein [Sporomusaceae bacterium]|nr:methyl-accepting chemotaxis protein [Sporomusaceae bacterium]
MLKMNSIKAKLSLVMLLIMIVSLCTLGGINYWNARKIVIEDAESNLQTLALNYSDKLGFWVEKRKAEMTMLANSPILVAGNKEEIIRYMQSESKRNPAYSRFLVADLNGNTYYSNGAVANIGDRDYFKQSKAGKTVISDPVVSKVDGKLVAVVSTPIMKNGAVVAVMGGTLSMDEVSAIITAIKVGDSGYAYLKQNDGFTIAHPDPNTILKNNPLTEAGTDPSLKAMTEKMVRGETGLDQYVYKGEKKYVAYAPVPETTWSLAVNAPVSEVTGKVISLMWTSLFIVLLCLVIVAVLVHLFAKKVAAPIEALTGFAQSIAQGDLTKNDLAVQSDDEIGRLGLSFQAMAQNLRHLIKQVSGSAEQVSLSAQDLTTSSEQSAAAVNQVATSISDVAQGAQHQLMAVAKAMNAVEKMSGGIDVIASDAGNVAEEALRTASMAKEGSSSAEKAIMQMNKIEQIVAALAEVIDKLGSNSKVIGQIVDTISGIAGQTNLLALNAAIEAARAGDQGRGFAVVAEEVRKLAEQSQESAKQIADLIGEIQLDTDKAVVAMQQGSGEVRLGADLVGTSGSVFQNIAEQIDQSAKQAASISETIQAMASGSREIVASVKEIDELSKLASGRAQTVSATTEEQSAFMEEIAAASQKLVTMSGDLEEAVRKFRV